MMQGLHPSRMKPKKPDKPELKAKEGHVDPRLDPDAHFLSASQLKLFQRCKRRWGFVYLHGLREPDTNATKLGKRVHKALEDHIDDKKTLDLTTREGKIAYRGLPFLPLQRPMTVEGYFEYTRDGYKYRGYIDLDVEVANDDEYSSYIIDHKTSRNPKKWALTVEGLTKDIQAVLYAAHKLDGLKRHKSSDAARLRWLYYPTETKGDAIPVDTVMNRREVDEAFVPIARLSRQIHDSFKVKHPNDLEPNFGACNDYHKLCHVAHLCNRSSMDILEGMFADNTTPCEKGKSSMSLSLSNLARRSGKNQTKSGDAKTKSKARDKTKVQDKTKSKPTKAKDSKTKARDKSKSKTKAKDKTKSKSKTKVAAKDKKPPLRSTPNSPESPKSKKTQKTLSKATKDVEGKKKEQRNKARRLAEAASTGKSVEKEAETQKKEDVANTVAKSRRKALALNEVWLQLRCALNAKETEQAFEAYLKRFP